MKPQTDLIDLHTHSTCSDGTMTPSNLVDHARNSGLKVIALTDHDTVAGTAEAVAQGRLRGIEVIPGIEVSAWHDGVSMHILGYWLRPDDEQLLARLARLQEARHVRNLRIVENLQRLGIAISMEELQQEAGGGQLGRPHIARLLVAKKIVRHADQAFALYLRRGAVAYAERFKYKADEAIAMIREAGGLAVLAHPALLDSSLRTIPALVASLAGVGLAGIEVYYPSHSPKAIRQLRDLAASRNLLATGGSDFHGEAAGRGFPGLTGKKFRVPYQLYESLKNEWRKQNGEEPA
ncbi:MAG: hypothetical protein A2521_13405 [Deltaproteobacteria bacterium RIFOXYD12_FULL_57_12]|nr:MAG: hypothetical protein A2521_13405 [Deltaproteobacteria bacterium RIFOXYD12_FULL_57_12]